MMQGHILVMSQAFFLPALDTMPTAMFALLLVIKRAAQEESKDACVDAMLTTVELLWTEPRIMSSTL